MRSLTLPMSETRTASATWVDRALLVFTSIWVVAIGWISLVVPARAWSFPVEEKALHAGVYGVLTLLLLLALVWRPRRGSGRFPHGTWLIGLGVAALSLLLEVIQIPVPVRQPEGLDLLANLAGVTAALLVWGGVRQVFVGPTGGPTDEEVLS